jgi:hypothetical protein
MSSFANESPRAETTTMNLFQGARFWLSLTVPQRPRFKELIKVFRNAFSCLELAEANEYLAIWRHSCADGEGC